MRFTTPLRRWWKRYGHESSIEFLVSFCFVMAVGSLLLKMISLNSMIQCRQELPKVIRNKINISQVPLVFVTGTSMTAVGFISKILNRHPQLRHWEHASVLVRIHHLRYKGYTNKVEAIRLRQAGVSIRLYDDALIELWRHILAKYEVGSQRPMFAELNCLQSSPVTLKLFPNAKFLFVLRDGRAAVYDNHGEDLQEDQKFNSTFYKKMLAKWNTNVEIMYKSCNNLGKEHCMMISYEDILLDSRWEILNMFKFLELNTNMSTDLMTTTKPIEDFIYATGLSSIVELVVGLKNTVGVEGTLWRWVNFVPEELKYNMDKLAPMLQVLGYDPFHYPQPAFISNYDIFKPNSIMELIVRMKNTGTLWQWVNFVPDQLKDDMDVVAPMLQVLGYDPFNYPKPAFISNYDNETRARYE